jgi:hypothetical protein
MLPLSFKPLSSSDLAQSTAIPAELTRYAALLGVNTDAFVWNHPSNLRGARRLTSTYHVKVLASFSDGYATGEIRTAAREQTPKGYKFANLGQLIRTLLECPDLYPKKGLILAFGGVVLSDPGIKTFESRLVPSASFVRGKPCMSSSMTLASYYSGPVFVPVVKQA